MKVAEVLFAPRVPAQPIEAERVQALEHRLAATAHRSVVGVMNEFARLADLDRAKGLDLVHLSMRAGHDPMRSAPRRHVSPDRELAALIAGLRDAGQPGSPPDSAA